MPRINRPYMIPPINIENPETSVQDIARRTRDVWGDLNTTATEAMRIQEEIRDRIFSDWPTDDNLCQEVALPPRAFTVSVTRPTPESPIRWRPWVDDSSEYIAEPRYGQISRRYFDEYSESDADLVRRAQEMYLIHDHSYDEYQRLNFRQEGLDVPRRRNGHDIFNVQDIVLVRGKEKPYVIYKRGDDEEFFVLLPYKGSPWQSSVTRALERGEVTMDEAIHVFHKDRQVKKKFMRKLGHDEIRRFDYHQIIPAF